MKLQHSLRCAFHETAHVLTLGVVLWQVVFVNICVSHLHVAICYILLTSQEVRGSSGRQGLHPIMSSSAHQELLLRIRRFELFPRACVGSLSRSNKTIYAEVP